MNSLVRDTAYQQLKHGFVNPSALIASYCSYHELPKSPHPGATAQAGSGEKLEAIEIAKTRHIGMTIHLPRRRREQRPGVTVKGNTCPGRLLLIRWSFQCDACSRRCCASRSHCAIFWSFAATSAQPTAVPPQR